jgi:hypothetical protein
MSVINDWATSATNPKYSTARQVYRPNKYTIGYYDATRPDKQTVYVKERVRGRGNTTQFRFANDGDKPFTIYGFAVNVGVARRV